MGTEEGKRSTAKGNKDRHGFEEHSLRLISPAPSPLPSFASLLPLSGLTPAGRGGERHGDGGGEAFNRYEVEGSPWF